MSTTARDVDSRERAAPTEQGVLDSAREPHPGQEEPTATSTSTLAAPAAEQLDLETVLQVPEEISGELVQEKFIDRLMRAAIEHAGAERVFLIVPQGDELQGWNEDLLQGLGEGAARGFLPRLAADL